MTPDQINRKIAEVCGWTFPCKHCAKFGMTTQWRNPSDTGCVEPSQLPNYFGDLNSVAEAEKILTDEQFQSYYEQRYWEAAKQTPSADYIKYKRIWLSSTAPQRCEALLRTLGLWEEGE